MRKSGPAMQVPQASGWELSPESWYLRTWPYMTLRCCSVCGSWKALRTWPVLRSVLSWLWRRLATFLESFFFDRWIVGSGSLLAGDHPFKGCISKWHGAAWNHHFLIWMSLNVFELASLYRGFWIYLVVWFVYKRIFLYMICIHINVHIFYT